MKRPIQYLIPALIIFALYYIVNFLLIIRAPDRSWASYLSFFDIIYSGWIETWTVLFTTIILSIIAIKKYSLSIIIINIALIMSWGYIQTLIIWQSKPGPKIDTRLTNVWSEAWFVFANLLICLLCYILILVLKKKSVANRVP